MIRKLKGPGLVIISRALGPNGQNNARREARVRGGHIFPNLLHPRLVQRTLYSEILLKIALLDQAAHVKVGNLAKTLAVNYSNKEGADWLRYPQHRDGE